MERKGENPMCGVCVHSCPGLPRCSSELQLQEFQVLRIWKTLGPAILTAMLLPAQKRSPAQCHKINLTAATRPNRGKEHLQEQEKRWGLP